MRVSELKNEMDARFSELQQSLDERFSTHSNDIRRHFNVVAEQLRAEIRLAFEKSMATGEQIGRLTAANVADHGAFEQTLLNHESRITSLESK